MNPVEIFGQKALSRKWPPEEALRQMMAEATDLQLAELLGYHRNEVSAMRAMLCVPPFPRGGSSIEKAERRKQFLAKWRPQMDAVGFLQIDGAALTRTGQEATDMSAITLPERKPAPPITAGQLLVEIRHFHKEHHRWPTIAEMAVTTERSLDQIKDKVRILRNQGLLDKDGLQLVITDTGGGVEAPVTKTVWTKEQLEAHLRSLRVDPTPGSTKVLKAEEPPKKEETEEMGKVRMVPSDEQILADVDALKASGARGIYKTLAEQYGVPVGTVAPAIQRARLRQTANLLQTAPSTMPTEAPERPQEATDAPAQGVGPTEQAPEQAQEPGIIGGVATEGEGQSEGAEEQERRHGAMLNITEDDEDEHPAQALEQAAKQWRDRRMGRLVLVLSEEIGDDATLGRLVRRLIREGVA